MIWALRAVPTAATASLSRAALRWVAALIAAHGKDVGASGGLAAIREMAPSWRPLLQQAPVADVRPPPPPPAHLHKLV